MRPQRIKAPTTTVFIADTTAASGGTWAFEWEHEPPAVEGQPRRLHNLVERHNDTLNALYCDGHVKAVTLDHLMQRNAAGTMTAFTIEDD